MPLVQTRGAASAQGFGEFAQASAPVYIEDVYSTYVYTGNASTQTITNDIDLSTKGGLVWIKRRNNATGGNYLATTVGGTSNYLQSNTTSGYETGVTTRVTSFNTNGFSLGAAGSVNSSGDLFVGWTFRKQPKFFDIVTFTTNGSPNPNTGNISHNLGSTPGCVMVKSTSGSQDWKVYHIGTEGGGLFAINRYLQLNDTSAPIASTNWINVSSTTISFPGGALDSGVDFIAYLFAHNAGGFGLTGADNVISCGSFTSDGSGGCSVTLGYEPQWLLYKNITSGEVWRLEDVMRGWNQSQLKILNPNSTAVEQNFDNSPSYLAPTSTGFNTPTPGLFTPGEKFVYIAIRRGPMKVPTLGTTVFEPAIRTGTGADVTITTSTYPVDMAWIRPRNNSSGYSFYDFDRLRGARRLLNTDNTQDANNTSYTLTGFDVQNGYYLGDDAFSYGTNVSGTATVSYNFRRAAGYFDGVTYKGNGTTQTITHNLTVVPELLIVKAFSGGTGNWSALLTNVSKGGWFNLTNVFYDASTAINQWGNGTSYVPPTSTQFTVGPDTDFNASSVYYVAYAFATVAGVSKVGSYTGNGSTQTINCGFTSGARFVLIRRTDTTGSWYVYDTARGMTLLTDPYLLLNSSAGEVATLGSVTTVSTGFAVDNSILAGINAASPAAYIFLAIA